MTFFETIINFFTALFDIIDNVLTSTIFALNIVTQSVSSVLTLNVFLPAILGSCVMVVIAIGVIKLILGWGNG